MSHLSRKTDIPSAMCLNLKFENKFCFFSIFSIFFIFLLKLQIELQQRVFIVCGRVKCVRTAKRYFCKLLTKQYKIGRIRSNPSQICQLTLLKFLKIRKNVFLCSKQGYIRWGKNDRENLVFF